MSQATAPFKFLDSYKQEDHDIFFGREKETNDLYHALSGVKHLLVYGPSGAGKTSLVECGLRNQFSDADWYALTIRRGSNIAGSVFNEINKALREKMDLDPETRRPLDSETDFGQAIERLFSERYQPVYLLFDQFEELLISGSDAEKRDFFTRLNQLIRYKVPCRVMLIMREEFIGHLSEFEPLCPSIFQHRFRLEKMRKENVKEVIRETLDAPHYRPFFRVEDSEQLAESILGKLPDKSREIELAHVQVFLSELWDRARTPRPPEGGGLGAGSTVVLHAGLIREGDNLAGVLDSFLNKQLKELDPIYGEKAPLEALAAMISERHTKLQLGAEELQKDLDIKEVALKSPLPNLLRDLEQRRILRTIKSGDQTQYEISHDVLALVVGQNLTKEMQMRAKAADIYRVYEERKGFFSQEDLDYIRPYQQYKAYPLALEQRIQESEDYLHAEGLRIQREKDEQLKAAQRQAEQERALRTAAELAQNRSRQRTNIAIFVAFLAFFGLGAAVWQSNKANEATVKAVDAGEKAEMAKKEALDSAAVARQQRQIANENVLKTLSANEITAEALRKLEITADQALTIVLPDIDRNIYRLEYDSTYPKCRIAVNLKARRREVEKRVWEMAYFYTEADSAKAAIAFLNLLKPNSLSITAPNIQDRLRTYLAKMIPAYYMDSLKARYYPRAILVAGGSFSSLQGFYRKVQVDSFWMGEKEITYWQYNLFARAKKHHIEPPSWEYAGDNPAVFVNWYDAAFYLNWLSERLQKTPAYTLTPAAYDNFTVKVDSMAKGCRLPTGVEWEFAARGGNKTREFEYSGSDEISKVGWCKNSSSRTHPVGQKKTNELGLYDMSGNVWEWGRDTEGLNRVIRGGSWVDRSEYCRTAYRMNFNPLNRCDFVGFRLVFVP